MKSGLLVGRGYDYSLAKVNGDLEEYYKLLGITCIDVVRLYINGVECNVVCDDEALCKENPRPTIFDKGGQPLIFGPVFIMGGVDRNGDLVGLTYDEACKISENITRVVYVDGVTRTCVMNASY